MNTPLRRVAGFAVVLLLALVANLSYVQVIGANSLRQKPGNSRTVLSEYDRARGPMSVGNRAVAASVPTNGQFSYVRTYANGPLYAHTTGYYSLLYGASGLERAENSVLAGTDDRLLVDRLTQLLAGRAPAGGSVQTTLLPAAQRAAADGLAGRRGAVVALDPATGAILAMVSSPSFDPNLLASPQTSVEREAWTNLTNDPASPLLNRSLAQVYPPGSTFKLVTAAAALSTGKYTKDSVIPGPATLKLPLSNNRLPNENGKACGPSNKTTLENALRISCNTAFASLGLAIGNDAIAQQAEKFGFNQSFSVPLNSATSNYPLDADRPQTALSAIGQFDVRSTVLQMALVAAGIGNGGVVMQPYLVARTRGPDLAILDEVTPKPFGRAVTTEVAGQLRDMMVTVVAKGTGRRAAIKGVTVAGKTGTAQQGNGRPPHAWFVSFAPATKPTVAVAVIVEDGGGATEISGGRLAAPIARAVMKAVLGR